MARFEFFGFFANCEYFEEMFNYGKVLKLPTRSAEVDGQSDDPCEAAPLSFVLEPNS